MHQRYIQILKNLSYISGILSFIIFLVLLIQHGLAISGKAPFALVPAILFFIIPLFVRTDNGYISRLIFSWLPTVIIMTVSVVSKKVSPENISVNDYFDFRYLMVVTNIIPLLLFSVNQKKSVIIGLLPGFLLLIFFDKIHVKIFF
jgi:hypothetical protein